MTHHARLQAIEIAQTSPAFVFQPPQPDESQWERVRDYLLNQRKLPDYLIDTLHQMGTAKQIKRIIAHAQRQRPLGEDWNADLQQPPQSKSKSQFELE